MKQLPVLDYAKANDVLRRGSRKVLLGASVATLFLAGILAYMGPRLGWDPFLLVLVGGTFLSSIWLGAATYRKLSLRVSEIGFEVRDRSGRTTLPWHAIQEITAGEQSLRIRAPGYPDIRIDLQPVRNLRPLWEVIATRRPDARLTVSEDELLVRSAPLSRQWSLLPTSLRIAVAAFIVHGLLSLMSFVLSSPPQLYEDQETFWSILRVILIWAFAVGILRREGKRAILGLVAFGLLLESLARLVDLISTTALTPGQMGMVSALLLSVVIGAAAMCWPGTSRAPPGTARSAGRLQQR